MSLDIWRDKQVQYTPLRSLQGRYADFWQVTGDALDFTLDSLGLATPALRDRLMDLYLSLSAFPEVADTLLQLRNAGFITAILSNGSPAMLDAAVRGAGLHDLLDAVLSADAVQVFKTHPHVYEYALEPPRVCRRLQPLRGWGHEQANNKQVFRRCPCACCADGIRA